MKEIVFSGHAESKFQILREHGFEVSREVVVSAVLKPDKFERGHIGKKGRTDEPGRDACDQGNI